MKSNEPPHLKIIPFSGTDYSLGDYLADGDGALTENWVEISNKLSLYFQWSNIAKAQLSFPRMESSSSCVLSYDTDEEQPTEIYVKFSVGFSKALFRSVKRVHVRYEVFRVCYEFVAPLLAVQDEDANTHWDLVLGVPSIIKTIKNRKLPRLKLDTLSASALPISKCVLEANSDTVSAEIVEIGLSSIGCKVKSELNQKKYFLRTDVFDLNVSFLRQDGELAIFAFQFEDSTQFGNFFDAYRKIAFPSLTSRSEFNSEDILALYQETGYFEHFLADSVHNSAIEITETWDKLRAFQHDFTADYVAVDSNGDLCGASSTTMAFKAGDEPFWVFHQLCSRTSPSLLANSGQLYTWRAEYLAARPEKLNILAWFSSRSRWLERIYVKFSLQKHGRTRLYPINLIVGPISKLALPKDNEAPRAELVKMGPYQRLNVEAEKCIGAVGPEFLNASKLLNNVLGIMPASPKLEDYSSVISAIAANPGDNVEVYLSLPAEEKFLPDGFRAARSDRLCFFSKEDLFDFLSSVEHSIEVTKRKLNT